MLFTAAASALSLAAVASATKSLTLSVSAPAAVSDVSDLEVVTTFTNTGDETLNLLKDPRTALSSWATAEAWEVSADTGAVPDFTGVRVRYIAEHAAKNVADATIALAAGESIDITHEVGNYYNFTGSGASTYSFTPSTTFQLVDADGSLSTIEATLEKPAAIALEGQLASTKVLKATSLGGTDLSARELTSGGLSKRASYSSCSSTRQTQNNAAITAGATLARNSISHLQANPSGSTLQTTWYGTFSSSRYSTTLASFQTLVSAPASWTYDCTCTDSGTYAYVYPSRYGTVYLCGYYWNAPATGSGSRADTIIHEGTHFPQVLGTDDYTYGESSCKSLARSNPTNAVYNADNHAFFSDYA